MSKDSVSNSLTASDLYLAIDQGGQSTRVAVYSEYGEQICNYSAACATEHRQTQSSAYPHIEQNGEEILAGIRECLQKIQLHLGDNISRIRAASFAGQGSSLLCWNNQTGQALTPVLSWQDIRGEPYLKTIALTNNQVQQLTGVRLSPHYGATKMRWCLEHSEAVIQARQNHCLSIGPIVSYIFWHLCEQKVTGAKQVLVDPGHAQRTLLWSLQQHDWDQSLLDAFQIPRELLPQCRYHNSHFGSFTLGNQLIPFTASARDQGASLFARGMPESDCVYINIGTGAFIQRVSESLRAPEGLLVSPLWLPEHLSSKNPVALNQTIDVASLTCYAEEFANAQVYKSLYAWEATVNGAASAMAFMQEQTGLAITPQEMEHALALNPAGNCYFLNAVGGLSAPYWRTDLESKFSGDLSSNEKILAWLESVIFQIVVNVQLMNQLGAVKKIIISGGFSKSNSVCQKIADLTQANVHRSDNADATVQGAACMAAGLPNSWRPAVNEEIFRPQQNLELEKRFAKWQQAMGVWLSELL